MITTDRFEFIGAHVTGKIKRALKTHARKNSISISAYIYRVLKRDLAEEGYDVKDMSDEEISRGV